MTEFDVARNANMTPAYEWHIEVQQLNHYGDRVVQRTPMVVVAATRDEVTSKVRAAFGATYDDFRKFWSHGWSLREVREVAPVSALQLAVNTRALMEQHVHCAECRSPQRDRRSGAIQCLRSECGGTLARPAMTEQGHRA